MLVGWLKGIFASILSFVAIPLIFFGLAHFNSTKEADTTVGAMLLIIGLISGSIGSYFKYVSKQTVKTKK